MKTNEFNKFGGTEFRTSEPIVEYNEILFWIKETQEKIKKSYNAKKYNWDEKFKKFIAERKSYYYNDSIERFNFITKHLTLWGFIKNEKGQNGEYLFNFNFKKNSNNLCLEDLFIKKMYMNWSPFKHMIDFIIEAKEDKINVNKLVLAFSVFENGDKFSDLYYSNKNEILKFIISNKNCEDILKIFRKPPKEAKMLEAIADCLKNGKLLTWEKFNECKPKNFKYIKYMFSDNANKSNIKNNNFFTMINDFIKNNSYDDFVKKIKMGSVDANIFSEYKDLFTRWMFKLCILNNKRDTEIIKSKLYYVNLNKLQQVNDENFDEIIIIDEESKIESEKNKDLPYTVNQVKNVLEKIQMRSFDFKKEKEFSKIKMINNATIAEYFVNLYFAHKLKLTRKEFKNSCNTLMDIDLFPSYTAPGGKPDFAYFCNKSNTQIVVETTILHSKNEVIKNESYPIANHTKMLVSTLTKNVELYFVNYLDWKSKESKCEVERAIRLHFYDKIKIESKKLYLANFKQLANSQVPIINEY